MLPRSRWWTVAPILLSVVFAAAVLPVIFLGSDATSEATDEAVAHLPAVRQFAAELPAPDLSDYPSATSPGYHLLMSLPARAGLGVHGLRVLGSLAGLALVLLAWRMAAACAGPAVALALALPLACSTYVLSGCAWLTTDVLSVLIASATVAVAAFMPPRPRTFVALAALVELGDDGTRLGGELGIPFHVLARRERQLWRPDSCPLCKRGTPLSFELMRG